MAFDMDDDCIRDYLRALFSVGLFGAAKMDLQQHLCGRKTAEIHGNGLRLFLPVAGHHGSGDNNLWFVHALGLLPVQTVGNRKYRVCLSKSAAPQRQIKKEGAGSDGTCSFFLRK